MRFLCAILIPIFFFSPATVVAQETATTGLAGEVRSAILMEQSSGQVLFEKDADERVPIASVTKTMTMLLAMEALNSGVISKDTMITVSEYAASMGGSQVFLSVGEQMSFNDIFKAIVVASANDATVALAEHLAGTEAAFVTRMNERATELGMKNTHFINCNGLDDGTEAFSSARDVALIAQALLEFPTAIEYTTIWMDCLRGGEFELVNTNKLVRFYEGITGVKTGFTDSAGSCLAASAMRDGMHLIAVVLGAPSSSERFDVATDLLNYGFANYAVLNTNEGVESLPNVTVTKGTLENVGIVRAADMGVVVPKGKVNAVSIEIDLPNRVQAPIAQGQKIGVINYTLDGDVVATVDLVAAQSSDRIGFWKFWMRLINNFVTMR